MIASDILQRTPLYEDHLSLHARMVPFGGWEMPLQYDGILAEYEHTRRAAALFDTSHMGEFIVEGGCLESGLDRILTMSLADMPVQSCRYGLMLNEQGGVIDDLVVFREAPEKWFIVVNGATAAKDARHFRECLLKPEAFRDISSQIGKIDVQGPLSRQILASLVPGIEKLAYYTFDRFDFLGETVRVSRTGYTGELGYEIYSSADTVSAIWRKLLLIPRVKPAGLGARDILRLEMGYSLYGHELDEHTTPLEAGLGRFVDFRKDFIGKTALLRQQKEGMKKKIIGLVSETRRSPRQDHAIYSKGGEEIGRVSSGAFSPSCQKGIGLGFVAVDRARQGEKIFFGHDQNAAIIAERIFHKKGTSKD